MLWVNRACCTERAFEPGHGRCVTDASERVCDIGRRWLAFVGALKRGRLAAGPMARGTVELHVN